MSRVQRQNAIDGSPSAAAAAARHCGRRRRCGRQSLVEHTGLVRRTLCLCDLLGCSRFLCETSCTQINTAPTTHATTRRATTTQIIIIITAILSKLVHARALLADVTTMSTSQTRQRNDATKVDARTHAPCIFGRYNALAVCRCAALVECVRPWPWRL